MAESSSTVPSTQIVKAEDAGPPVPAFIEGLSNLSTVKQIGLMIGLSASIALGLILVLWSKEPELRPLGRYEHTELVQVVEFLESKEIYYRLEKNGQILVDRSKFQNIKLGMVSEGIGTIEHPSDEILSKDTGFGVSEKLETARLLRAQEKSLARTIEQFSGVSSAQVHLAIPKVGVFVRDKRKPSASVLLNVKGYDSLGEEQVRSIVDLVSGSVPELTARNVTITDQYGRLHHSGSMSVAEIEDRKKFTAEQKRQSILKQKIEEILIPLVGLGKYTVQVNVDLDFSKREQTRRSYNNDLPAVRSERTVDDYQVGKGGVQGVPGALSNQPPNDAEAPETLGGPGGGASSEEEIAGNRRLERERNYDLDTTISYTQQQSGSVQRITVAIGLDYIDNPDFKPASKTAQPAGAAAGQAGAAAAGAAATPAADPQAATATGGQNAANAPNQAAQQPAAPPQPKKIPRTDEEIENIRRLVQGVIGFSPQRGDSVEVLSLPFARFEIPVAPEPQKFYEQSWFEKILKPAVMLFGLLFIIFGVLRPIMRKLATPTVDAGELAVAKGEMDNDAIKIEVPEPAPDEVTISHDFEALGLPEPAIESAAHIKQAKSIAMDNSTMVAQVIRNWMEEDG